MNCWKKCWANNDWQNKTKQSYIYNIHICLCLYWTKNISVIRRKTFLQMSLLEKKKILAFWVYITHFILFNKVDLIIDCLSNELFEISSLVDKLKRYLMKDTKNYAWMSRNDSRVCVLFGIPTAGLWSGLLKSMILINDILISIRNK